MSSELRKLPAVGALLERPEQLALAEAHGAGLVKHAVRHLLAEARLAIQSGAPAPSPDHLAEEASQRVRRLVVPALRRAVNASGNLLHTGLGRAPLGEAATAALADCRSLRLGEAELICTAVARIAGVAS